MGLSSDTFSTVLALAIEHYKSGNYQESKGTVEEILRMNPAEYGAVHLLALCELRLNNLDPCRTAIKTAIQLRPEDPANWNVLGESYRLQANYPLAIEAFERAISLHPVNIESLNNLGITREQMRSWEEAESCFRKALTIDNSHALSWYNLANLLTRIGRLEEALLAYREALRVNPSYAEALNNYALTLMRLHRYTESLEVFDGLTSVHPTFHDGLFNYASTLKHVGRSEEALKIFERALTSSDRSTRPRTLAAVGVLLRELGKRTEARQILAEAASLAPDQQDVLHARVNLEIDCGNYRLAKELVEKIALKDPSDIGAHFCLTSLQLPPIYESEEELARARTSYSEMLEELSHKLSSLGAPELRVAEELIGGNQPFFLPYQGLDCLDLQQRYGSMVTALMARAIPLPTPRARTHGDTSRVRVGFVSGFYRNHSNYKMPLRGWIRELNKDNFQVFGYHTQHRIDDCTVEAESFCERFYQGPKSFREWIEIITRDQLDVLIFPEIGMDPMTCRLASLRLAPTQATSWGHPVTSGFPTIDYFLSSAAMEPIDGDSHYSETLIRLPNLSIVYERPILNPVIATRADRGIREDAIAYWCCQTYYKYLPQFDWVYPEIATRVPSAQFIFITIQPESEIAATLRRRLRSAFEKRGIDPEKHLLFLGSMSMDIFGKTASMCDVSLDSIGWSGCNSAFETLAQGVPIITCAGRYMRARHTAAILEAIGCSELITDSPERFVELATQLGLADERRQALRNKIRQNIGSVYNDTAPVRELERLLSDWARK